MRTLLVKWALLVVALVLSAFLTSLFVKGFTVAYSSAGEIFALFLGVGVIALLNATVGTLLNLLTLPLSCITLGLFRWVVNALVFNMAGQVSIGFRTENFTAAFIGATLYTLIGSSLTTLFSPEEKDKKQKRD